MVGFFAILKIWNLQNKDLQKPNHEYVTSYTTETSSMVGFKLPAQVKLLKYIIIIEQLFLSL